jgi:toxin FitB
VRHGLELLSAGRRRRALEEAFVLCLEEDFEGRILAFDRPCAEAAGRLGAQRSRLGRTVETRDLQLAGMALARRATLATHNSRHFQGLGIEIVDPWAVR